MRTETDLNSVKSTARSFLYLDFNETTFSPMIIKHPFTDSGYICLPESEFTQPINILENEKALEKWHNFMRERIDECSSVSQVYMLITKPYKFAFIKYIENFMSKDDLLEILAVLRLEREAKIYKERYPKGTRIELLSMNDSQAVPPGTRGTVDYVDDLGTIHMKWDNGRTLGI